MAEELLSLPKLESPSHTLPPPSGGFQGLDKNMPSVEEAVPIPAASDLQAYLKADFAKNNPYKKTEEFFTPIASTPLDVVGVYTDPSIGYSAFSSYREREDAYVAKQSWYGNLGRNLINFGAKTVSTAIGNFDYSQEFGTLAGKDSAYSKDSFKNSLIEWADEVQKKNHVFETSYIEQHPYLAFINPFEFTSFANRWGDVINNLGFTAGSIVNAIATDAALTLTTGVGELAVIPAQGAKIISSLFNAFKGNKLLQTANTTRQTISALATTNKIAQNIKTGLTLANSALGEASVEGYMNFKDTKNSLIKDYQEQYGVAPDSQELSKIEEYARASGSATTWANTGLLMATNWLSFGSIFRPIQKLSKSADDVVATSIDQVAKREVTKKASLLDKASASFYKGITKKESIPTVMLSEAFEEGAQFTISKKNEDYWSRKYNGTDEADQNWKSWMYGVHETFNSREGIESMIMGALSGPSIHGVKALNNYARSKAKGLPTNNKDAVVNQTIGLLNRSGISGMFSSGYDGFVTASENAKLMEKALNSGDITSYKNFRSDQLFNRVNTAIATNHFEVVQDQLNMSRSFKEKDFENLFGLTYNNKNTALVNNYIDKVIEKSVEIKEIIDDVNDAFGKNPFSIKEDAHSFKAFENYKEALAHSLVTTKDSSDRYEEHINKTLTILPNANIKELQNLLNKDGVRNLNTKINKRLSELNNLIAIDGIDNQVYKDELNNLLDISNKLKNTNDPAYYRKFFESGVDFYGGKTKVENVNSEKVYDTVYEQLKAAKDLSKRAEDSRKYYETLSSKKGFNTFKKEVADLIENKFESRIKIDENGITILSEKQLEEEKRKSAADSLSNLSQIRSGLVARAAEQTVNALYTPEQLDKIKKLNEFPEADLNTEDKELLFSYRTKIEEESARLNGEFDSSIDLEKIINEEGVEAALNIIRTTHDKPSFAKDMDISSINNLFGSMPFYLPSEQLKKLYAEAKRNPQLFGIFLQQTPMFDFLFNTAQPSSTVVRTSENLVNNVTAKNKKDFITSQIENVFSTAFGKKGSKVNWKTAKELDEIIEKSKSAKFNIVGEKALLPETVKLSLETARLLEKTYSLPTEYWKTYPLRSQDLETDTQDEVYDNVMRIYTATGWQRGVDGMWRYDLGVHDNIYFPSIEGNSFYGKDDFFTTLDKVLDAPSLYEAYPSLKDIKVFGTKNELITRKVLRDGIIQDVQFQQAGSWDPRRKRINLDTGVTTFEQYRTLIHELQHAIQDLEGFSKGSSIEDAEDRLLQNNEYLIPGFDYIKTMNKIDDNNKMFGKDNTQNKKLLASVAKLKFLVKEKFKADNWEDLAYAVYNGSLGEVEARNVSYRSNLLEDERREYLLSETEDVALEEKNNLFESFSPLLGDEAIYSVKPINQIIENESMLYNRYKGSNYFKKDPSDMFAPSTIKDSIEDINPDELIFTELGQSQEKLIKMGDYKIPEYNKYSTDYPIGFRYKNKIYLLDGHHRVSLAKRDNITSIKVAIKNISTDLNNSITFSTNKEGVLGFTSGNDIFLNSDALLGKSNNNVDGNTPIHEAGHLWMKWAAKNRPDLHAKGFQLVENSKYLKDVKADPFYIDEAKRFRTAKQKEDFFKDEALARAIGDRGESFLRPSVKKDFKDWLTSLFDSILKYFGIRELTSEQIDKLTFSDFVSMVSADIIRGQRVEDITDDISKQVDSAIEYKVVVEKQERDPADRQYSKISNSLYRSIFEDTAYFEAGGQRVSQLTGINTIFAKIDGEYIPLSEAMFSGKITDENFTAITGVSLKDKAEYSRKVAQYAVLADKIFNSGKTEFSDEEVRNMLNVSPLLGMRDDVNDPRKSTTLGELKALGSNSYILSLTYTYDKKGVRNSEPTINVIDDKGSSVLSSSHEIYNLVQTNKEMLKANAKRYVLVNRQPGGNFANTSFIFGRSKTVKKDVLDDLVSSIQENELDKTSEILSSLFIADKNRKYKGDIDLMLALDEIRPSDRNKIYSINTLMIALNNTRYINDREIFIDPTSFTYALPKDEDAKFSDFNKTLTVSVKPNIYKNIGLVVHPKISEEDAIIDYSEPEMSPLLYNNEALLIEEGTDRVKAEATIKDFKKILKQLSKSKQITEEPCK
jgi:hypothetical protein